MFHSVGVYFPGLFGDFKFDIWANKCYYYSRSFQEFSVHEYFQNCYFQSKKLGSIFNSYFIYDFIPLHPYCIFVAKPTWRWIKMNNLESLPLQGGSDTWCTNFPFCLSPKLKFSALTRNSGRKKNSGISSFMCFQTTVGPNQQAPPIHFSNPGSKKYFNLLLKIIFGDLGERLMIKYLIPNRDWKYFPLLVKWFQSQIMKKATDAEIDYYHK